MLAPGKHSNTIKVLLEKLPSLMRETRLLSSRLRGSYNHASLPCRLKVFIIAIRPRDLPRESPFTTRPLTFPAPSHSFRNSAATQVTSKNLNLQDVSYPLPNCERYSCYQCQCGSNSQQRYSASMPSPRSTLYPLGGW